MPSAKHQHQVYDVHINVHLFYQLLVLFGGGIHARTHTYVSRIKEHRK